MIRFFPPAIGFGEIHWSLSEAFPARMHRLEGCERGRQVGYSTILPQGDRIAHLANPLSPLLPPPSVPLKGFL